MTENREIKLTESEARDALSYRTRAILEVKKSGDQHVARLKSMGLTDEDVAELVAVQAKTLNKATSAAAAEWQTLLETAGNHFVWHSDERQRRIDTEHRKFINDLPAKKIIYDDEYQRIQKLGRNYEAILGVSQGASQDQIRAAFENAVNRLRLDKSITINSLDNLKGLTATQRSDLKSVKDRLAYIMISLNEALIYLTTGRNSSSSLELPQVQELPQGQKPKEVGGSIYSQLENATKISQIISLLGQLKEPITLRDGQKRSPQDIIFYINALDDAIYEKDPEKYLNTLVRISSVFEIRRKVDQELGPLYTLVKYDSTIPDMLEALKVLNERGHVFTGKTTSGAEVKRTPAEIIAQIKRAQKEKSAASLSDVTGTLDIDMKVTYQLNKHRWFGSVIPENKKDRYEDFLKKINNK